MSEPEQKPGQSEQVVGTPPEFIDAVERRFGPITFDLAATKTNRVRQVSWYGPGSPDGEDALAKPWNQLPSGLLWLNPPFEDIHPWARKSCLMGDRGAQIAFLVPLSSSNWARDYVHGHGQVEALNPRLRFISHKSLYPKDLMIVLFGPGITVGFNVWQWKSSIRIGGRQPRGEEAQAGIPCTSVGAQPLCRSADGERRKQLREPTRPYEPGNGGGPVKAEVVTAGETAP